MQTVAVFVAVLAVASANSVAFRVPSADSAVINSQRQGGNFAYSTQESQAFGVVSPVVAQVATPVAATYAVQQPIQQVISTVQQPQLTYTAALQQPIQQQLTYTAAVQQPIQQVVSVQQPQLQQIVQKPVEQQLTYTVQKPVEQQLTYTVQPQVQKVQYNSLPVASTYVASAPAWNQWYGNTVAPVQYAVVDAKKVESVDAKPVVQYGYSIQQGGAPAVVSAPQVGVAPVTYTAAASLVQQGTPADTYKTLAGVSPLGFNNVYGYGVQQYGAGQPWATGYQVVV